MRPGTFNRQELLDASHTTSGCTLHCMCTLGEAACIAFSARIAFSASLPASSAACSRVTHVRLAQARNAMERRGVHGCVEVPKVASMLQLMEQSISSFRMQGTLVLHAYLAPVAVLLEDICGVLPRKYCFARQAAQQALHRALLSAQHSNECTSPQGLCPARTLVQPPGMI